MKTAALKIAQGAATLLAIAAGPVWADTAPAADPAAAFMAANAKEKGVTTLPSGVEYKVSKSGPAEGVSPAPDATVTVNYELKLLDGTIIDSSYQRGTPSTFPLTRLIPAWQEAIPMMKPGDEWMLYVPPSMGYGEKGKGPIPPNSVLVFRIGLIGAE